MSSFRSILFKTDHQFNKDVVEEPVFFADLNLNQIIDAIVAGKEEYNLKPFFYTSLSETYSIKYRQEIMLDLENKTLFRHITSFAESMQNIRKQLSIVDKLYYKYHKERLFIDVVKMYCEAVMTLENQLSIEDIKSQGLLSFRIYLNNYVKSSNFLSLITEANNVIANLSSIKYCVRIKGLTVEVFKYESKEDYNAEIEKIFARFKQNEVRNYRVGFAHPLEMNHVEAQILDGVAQLYPDIFQKLDAFYSTNKFFLDKTLLTFEREIQFYISYLEYISIFKKEGLKFCYPDVSNTSKEIFCNETFDIALAQKLIKNKSTIVTNDFYLKNKERIIVVSGPNQSGKTTFARMFGQVHFLASIGCPIPGKEAKLFLYDKIFTIFEKKERIKDLRSKLEDDLLRIRDILNQASSNSIIIMNEIFTATTLKDALFLGEKIMEKLIKLDLLCVWVSFVYELASFSEQTVSMTGNIVPENPDLRTYKITRKPADGLAYALSIAKKHQLTYDELIKRIKV